MDSSLQGWHPDTYRRHEWRYYSVGRATYLVRDGAVEGSDPVDHLPEPMASDIPAVSAAAGAVASYTGDPEYRGSATTLRGPGRRRSWLVPVFLAFLAAAGFVAWAGTRSSGNRTAGEGALTTAQISPVDYVLRSVKHTLAQKTAELTLTGAVSVEGTTITMRGTGVGDLTADQMDLTATMRIQGDSVTLRELFAHSSLYFAIDAAGQTFRQLTGRDWVRMPVDTKSPLSSASPLEELRLIAQGGGTVRSLGAKTIDGHACQGYEATPSRAAIEAHMNDSLPELGLSPQQRADILNRAKSIQPPTITVWFDDQQILRREEVQLAMGGSTAGTVTATVDFTNYGTPVHITEPSSANVLTYAQFLKMPARH